MIRKLITLGLISTCFCQYNEDEQQRQSYDNPYYKAPPQILSHKQFLNHDGNFKYAFASENGLLQGESIAPDGSRTGAYAYVDPSGKKISVKYIAGKEGFKILEGDHIPKPVPLPVHHHQPQPGYQRYEPQNDAPFREDVRPVYDQFKPEYSKPPYNQYRPEIGKSLGHYKTEVPKPIINQYKSPNAAPFSLPRKPYQQPFANEATNEVQPYQIQNRYNEPKEPEYNDEPGKANSFGNGYAFEFSG